MKPACSTRGLCAAALLFSLAACGGGNSGPAFDAGSFGATAAAGKPAPASEKSDAPAADDNASSPSVNWAP